VNRKRRSKNFGTKRTVVRIRHIAIRAYDTGHGASKTTAKWQCARITHHSGFIEMFIEVKALITTVMTSGGKDEYQVLLTGIDLDDWTMGIWITD